MGAKGGKPKPGEPWIVGEKGPELFIPATAGTIIPANTTQAAIMAAATLQGNAPKQYPRKDKKPPASTPETPPATVPVTPAVPAGYPFIGENFDAYRELFMPGSDLSPGIRTLPPSAVPTPQPKKRRRVPQGPKQGGGWTNDVEEAIANAYQPFSGGSGQLGNQIAQVVGAVETNQGINAGNPETMRTSRGVVNNYFPITRIDDELDARQLARLVAAEMARMPSR